MKRVMVLLAVFGVSTAVFGSAVFEREKAGTCWQDGLLLGDGRTGALGYAPQHLEWTINRNDVFDTRVFDCDYLPHDEVMKCVATNAGHSVAFLNDTERKSIKGDPDGNRLTLSMSAAILKVRFWGGVDWSMPSLPPVTQRLDTRTGELVETMDDVGKLIETVSFIDRKRDVMVVAFSDPKAPARGAWVDLERPDDVRYETRPMEWKEAEGVISFTQRMPGGETCAVALSAPGKCTVLGRAASFRTNAPRALFLAVRTTRDGADPRALAVAAVKAAEKDGLAAVRRDNAAWWREFWTKGARASFTSAPEVDTLWNFSVYALGAQFGGTPMPALNGLAYGPLSTVIGGVGSNCYVHDQNVQIPMMPFFPLNHADYISSFVKTYMDVMPELERRTREVFGCAGAYLPLNMNPLGREAPIADYRYTLCGAAYSGLVLAQAWWYTHDEAILREIYPLLKKFILFYTETMTRDANGTYHFIWSVPPEIFTGSKDELATIACLKQCLLTAVEAATRFRCDEKELKLWQDILAHYPAFARQSLGGWWGGPEIPDDHYMYGGHLFYPFFPSESDCDTAIAAKTLEYTYDYAVEISHDTEPPHPQHEWSALYTGVATERIYGGERGWQKVVDFVNWFGKPNGLFCHNPVILTDRSDEEIRATYKASPKLMRRDYHNKVHEFGRSVYDLTRNPDAKRVVASVLEGSAGFLMQANEALCQSWGGEIRLFPAVAKNFSGRFENFRVHGGYTVTAEMKNGRVVDFDIKGVKKGEDIKVSCAADPDFKLLPGEPAWKQPVTFAPFPDQLSAYVFRNWSLVPVAKLAAVIGADAAQLRAIAAEMGLDPNPKVPAEMKRGGYVTILRRNWHLLPYSQILKLVDMTRRELDHSLMNDDFLLTKLGKDKPDAPAIVYSADLAAEGREARGKLKEMLGAEGVKIADPSEKPRFAFLGELGDVPEEPAAGGRPSFPDSRFATKLIFPYCADYGDLLADPDAKSCSEGLIARLAERGVNALWFHVVLADLSTDSDYPELGKDAVARREALKKLVKRAAKYGVKVFLYINEPRAQPASFFDVPGREGMRGAADLHGSGYCAMCFADPRPLKWLEGTLKSIFTEVKGLGGVFTITMSETTTHCASHFEGMQALCPRCKGKPFEEFIAQAAAAVSRGVHAGSPEAEVWHYEVGWERFRTDLKAIPMLPKGDGVIIWSEKYLPFEQGGEQHKVTEYSISHPGPCDRAVELWKLARANGMKCIAKLQVSDSWEMSHVPYLPAMDLVAEHALNLSASPVDSLMISWSLGGYPSPNLALLSELKPGDTKESVLDRHAKKLYGEKAAPFVRRAWTAYSEAFRNYPMEWQTVYYSPVQMSAANLLYAEKTGWPATMVNTPYDDYRAWTDGYGTNRQLWLDQMKKCAEGFAAADPLWTEVVAACEGEAKKTAAKEQRLFRAATLTFRTCVDQAEFILARDRGDHAAMKELAAKELATAKEMLALVRAESELGYESSNRYIYVPNDFLVKILNCLQLRQ